MRKQTMVLTALLIALTIAVGSHYTLYAGTFDPDIEQINFSIEDAVTGGPAVAGTLAGVASAQARLTGDTQSPPLGGPDAQVAPAAAELTITKTDNPDPVIAGEQITYTITVTNSGDAAAAFVFVGDTLPDRTAFDGASSSPECAQATAEDAVVCAIGAGDLFLPPPGQYLTRAFADRKGDRDRPDYG